MTSNMGKTFINFIEQNAIPGPHRYGEFTDTILAMLRVSGNKYESYFKVENGKVKSTRPLHVEKINPVSIAVSPYLAADVGKAPFAKAEAEYILKKMKHRYSSDQFGALENTINCYDEFTDEERNQYKEYKKLFKEI